MTAAPAIDAASNTSVFVSWDTAVMVFSSTGTLLRSYITTGVNSANPVIGADGTLYIASHDSKMYALTYSTFVLKWTYTAPAQISFAPAIASDGSLWFTNHN